MKVIFDLDGTISLLQHRMHLVETPMIECSRCNGLGMIKMGQGHMRCEICGTLGKVKDKTFKPKWNEFYEECDKDLPNHIVISMADILHSAGHTIYIMSGRMATPSVAKKTVKWLKDYKVKYHHLIMRPDGDFTPDDELKQQMIEKEKINLDDVLCTFDDRDSVCKMWRDLGLTCFQVAPGDF